MTQALKKTVLVLFIVCLYHYAGAQVTKGQKQDALLETIKTFNNAFKTGDLSTLNSMITDNYMHTNGSSKAIDKETWINYLRKREKDINSGELEVLHYNMEETKIEFYDNVAIVTAKVIAKNKTREEIKTNEYRVTNIWIYESGTWKRGGFHDGKID